MATTAQEWQQVLDQANAQKQTAQATLAAAADAAFQARSNANAAKIAVDNEVAANGGKLPLFSTTYKAWQAATAAETAAVNAENQAQAELTSINNTITTATKQLTTANTAPPEATNSVPQPVNPTPSPVNESITSTNSYANYVAVQTPQGNLLFPNQATYTAWQNNPASVAFATTPVGQIASLVPPTVENTAPTNVGKEDPFEAERLAAAERSATPSPTAQEVINAEDDPFERERMEAAQRLTDQEQIDYNKPPTTEDPSNPSSANYVNSADAASDAAAAQRGYQEDQDYIASGGKGLSGKVNNTREQATTQDSVNFNQLPDWRVRIALAPNSPNVLYKAQPAGILQPLQATQGVIFPYTPSIQVNYVANYDPFDLVHNNYKAYQYKNSSVEQVQITGDFTAQDTYEASYLLAVIHFFRSVTKMFYGRDENPKAGTPPPLCYLYGLGDFQFNAHPLAITSFNYSLPTEVDYIRAGTPTLVPGQPVTTTNNPNNSQTVSGNRMASNNLTPKTPAFQSPTNKEPTYVPTKMQISITAIPIVTRNDISNRFSLKDYATGGLLLGKTSKGGIW